MTILFLLHLAATLMMTGLIWFVQVVHYPLMRRVGAEGFSDYAKQHVQRTTWVVAPAMLGEVLSALVLLTQSPELASQASFQGSLGLLFLVWVSTAALQIPRHRVLESGFHDSTVRSLVATNWIRTIAWTVRSCLLLNILRASLEGSTDLLA